MKQIVFDTWINRKRRTFRTYSLGCAWDTELWVAQCDLKKVYSQRSEEDAILKLVKLIEK